MPQVISATYARDNFAEIYNRVTYAGEEFVVLKKGRPGLKIAPIKAVGKKAEKQKITGLEFAFRLANYHAKGLPADLAKNHDKYAWG